MSSTKEGRLALPGETRVLGFGWPELMSVLLSPPVAGALAVIGHSGRAKQN